MEWFTIIIIAAVLKGISLVIEKKTLMKENALEYVSVLTFILMIFFFFVGIATKTLNFNMGLGVYLWIYLASVLAAGGAWFAAKGIRKLEVSEASPLLTFEPIIVAVIAFLFLSEFMTLVQGAGIAFIIFGSYVLELDHKKHGLLDPFKKILKKRGIHFILLALVLWGVSTPIHRFILNPANSFNMNFINYFFVLTLFVVINYSILLHVFHTGFKKLEESFKETPKLFIVGVLVLGSARLGFGAALTMASAAIVITIYRTSSLFATIVGGEIFHEKRLMLKIISAVIMIVGTYFVIAL